MSKISEQKALEAYPLPKEEPYSTSFINQETFNSAKRTGYIVGYNQAIQDFMEKARTWFFSDLYSYLVNNSREISIDEIFRQFKNYMQNEEM